MFRANTALKGLLLLKTLTGRPVSPFEEEGQKETVRKVNWFLKETDTKKEAVREVNW